MEELRDSSGWALCPRVWTSRNRTSQWGAETVTCADVYKEITGEIDVISYGLNSHHRVALWGDLFITHIGLQLSL